MPERIDISFDGSPEVRAALHRFGRTEDIRFSPDSCRLALPSFDHNSIALVDVDIDHSAGRPAVAVTAVTELSASGLDYPHGVEFLDDETIVVANRNASVSLYRLLDRDHLVPLELAPGRDFDLLHGPSALAMAPGGGGDTEILVGHRYSDVLTRHVLHRDAAGAFGVTSNEALLHRWITIVDGAALSPDGRWLAISNPWHQQVLVYDTASSLDEQSDPQCILRGASYPHGVRFSPDGRHLFVADAGSPHVYVHTRAGETWAGVHYPAAALRVMDDDVFARGRSNCREGGPKGVDLDRTGRVLTVTAECQPLAFFDVSAFSDREPDVGDDDDRQLHYELDVVRASDALVAERVGELEARLAAITRSRAYRLASQLRHLKERGGHLRRSAR